MNLLNFKKYFKSVLFTYFLISVINGIAQSDTTAQIGITDLKPIFFETSFLHGIRLDPDHFGVGGFGFDMNLGHRHVLSDDNLISLFAGINITDLKENLNFAWTLGSRYSFFKNARENYIEAGVLLSPTLSGLDSFAGFNLEVGRKNYENGWGFFLVYDHYYTPEHIPGNHLRGGILLHKKAAIAGVAIFAGFVALIINAISRSQ